MKREKKYTILNMVFRLYCMAFKQYPLRMLGMSIVLFLNGINSVMVTYFTEKFFNKVEDTVKYGIEIPYVLFVSLGIMLSMIVIAHVLNALENYLGDTIHIWLKQTYMNYLHEKMDRIDLIKFENTTFLDRVAKAVEASGDEGCTFTVVAFMVVFLGNIPYILAMSIYLYRLHPKLLICIFLVFLPTLLSQFLKVNFFADLEENLANPSRRMDYYNECISGINYVRETRQLGAFNYFFKLYKEIVEKVNTYVWKTNGKAAKIDIVMCAITLVGYIGILILLVKYAVGGIISIGAFAAVFQSISMIFEIFDCAIVQQMVSVNSKSGLVRNYLEFLDEEERIMDSKVMDEKTRIIADNVTFSYPNSNNEILKSISLKIENNELLAIVGENGAGKSTLVKLLTGLYQPDKGQVLIGGIDTRECNRNIYQETISGIFQQFQKYKMLIDENVYISKPNKYNADRVKAALNMADADIGHEGNYKLDIMLSREFDGIELSSGQWQRIAIARGIYRDSNIIVLDEPTAAIDPIEEAKIYKKFTELAKGKIAILVTHRIGSCKIADRICVMDKGKIVEIGSHAQLMKKRGKYYSMYIAQSQWYKEEAN